MTDEAREVTHEEYQAEFDRSYKLVAEILDKAMEEMEARRLESGAVITAFLRVAADVAMSSGMEAEFAQAVGAAITKVANQGRDVIGRDDGMIQGLKMTARMNAGANSMPVAGMIPLLVHAAVELANEEGRLPQFIDMIAGMGRLAENMQRRDAGEPTKH